MDEMLTLAEIEKRYAPDWVLIGEPLIDEGPVLRGGKVLFHSPDFGDVCRKASEYPPGRYAIRYMGEIPADLVLVL